MSDSPPANLEQLLEQLRELRERVQSLETPQVSPSSPLGSELDAQLARQMFESQNLRDTLDTYERQRARVLEAFSGGTAALTADVAGILDQRFVPRMNGIVDGAKLQVSQRLQNLSADAVVTRAEAGLSDLESRFAQSLERFAKLREGCFQTEQALVSAAERMEALWMDQDEAGVGGWRIVMRSVANYVEQQKVPPPSPQDQFRGEDENSRLPPIINMPCPKCHSREVRRLERKNVLEDVLRLFSVAPFRCHACEISFYRFN